MRLRKFIWLAAALLVVGCDDGGGGSSGNDGGVDCDPAQEANCPGAAAPLWSLEDFQPQSPRFTETYGMEAFRGRPTLVALLSGW